MNSNIKKRLVTILIVAVLVFISLTSTPTRAKGSIAVLGEDFLTLDVYILDLPEVGSYRASNHSRVVEGAIEATKVNKFGIFLDWDNVVDVNVSVSAHVISDWGAYQMLIERGNSVIIVNTHDEYLPVPTGYTKEEWVDKITDLMLNRWGTWTHSGGYPLYRAWHQNGTTEEWGEQGFQRLTSHIGKVNLTCYPPAEAQSGQLATFEGQYLMDWRFLYENHSVPINSFGRANSGYPFNAQDFKGQTLHPVYILTSTYLTGGTIYFRQNQTDFNYGIYVHSSAWKFFDANDNEFPEFNDFAMGIVSTAAAVWADIGDATYQVYGTFSDSTPRDHIQVAKLEGRTMGLDQAEELLQKAIEEYNAHSYKLAVAYAKQAKNAADSATQPNLLPQIIVAMVVTFTTIGVGVYYKGHNHRRKKKIQSVQSNLDSEFIRIK